MSAHERPKLGSMEDRQPAFRFVTFDDQGRAIDPWPEAPYIPHVPTSELTSAGPLAPDDVGSPADDIPSPVEEWECAIL